MKEHDITPPDFHNFKDFNRTVLGLQTNLEPRDSFTDHTISYYDMEIVYRQYPCGNEHEETPGTYRGGLANAGRKLKDKLKVLYPGADTGLLYGDDKLYSKLSHCIQPMDW
ncbi:uncharacterized protein N7518_007051 [Penicillium psychrosexuale]|uniref:uncharacterized protein n=1 Tax=Penicillium psychrosexuale TaxID=1002107 RepID=UPI002544EBB3|nr:uncharacterized protein N7518_007051 [Penicillium psychrosexuale]KAJ5790040.1 hypothetical protein N7518_007051 [Penicillium psychrosexuale]